MKHIAKYLTVEVSVLKAMNNLRWRFKFGMIFVKFGIWITGCKSEIGVK